ncbi:uncharacterized protein LOC135487103 [Lineus longissimus]|uniref:uncharacterized protein LOC135487103 n=1 Tax=Lineus longissimus TaxID=88925 RepID=UPI00315D97BB
MCPENWKEHKLYCYDVSQYEAREADAERHCEDSKAKLLAINSQDENDWINATLLIDQGTSYWTGLIRKDIMENGVINQTFAWTDGSLPDDPEEFITWAPNEPNKGQDESCGEITGQGTFNDNDCSKKIKFICKKAKGCFTQTGEEGCSKCHCRDNKVCDPHYGNCSNGCDAQHLGFNCSTVLQIGKPKVLNQTDVSAVLRWPVWRGTTINSAGLANIRYQYSVTSVNGANPKFNTAKQPDKKDKTIMKRTIKGLSPATNYTLCVKVFHDNLKVNCSEQELVHFRTLCQAPPPPVDLQVAVLNRDSSTELGFVKVKLSWQVSETPKDSCPQVDIFRLFSREATPTSDWRYHSHVNSSLHQGELTLRINGSYDFMAQAVDTDENLANSNATSDHYIEPKECFLRHTDMETTGKNCTLCRCLNDGACNKYYGNCSEGCQKDYIGFNCSTVLRYPAKAIIISHVSDTSVTIRWKRWTENLNSDNGPAEISYGIKIKGSDTLFKMEDKILPPTANDDLEHIVEGLESNSNYSACINLFRDRMEGWRCRPSEKFRTVCHAPPRPLNMSVIVPIPEVGSSIVNLTIKYQAEGPGVCDTVTRYVVRYHKINAHDQEEGRNSVGSDIWHKLTLEAHHNYAIKLEVFNKDNMSSLSPTYWIYSQGLNQSSDFREISHSSTTAKLNWLPRRTMWAREHYLVSCHPVEPSGLIATKEVHPELKPEYPFLFQIKDLVPETAYKCNINDDGKSDQITFRTEAAKGLIKAPMLTIIIGAGASAALLLIIILVILVVRCRKKRQKSGVPQYEVCIHDMDLATFWQERASFAGSLASLDTIDEPIYINNDAVRLRPESEQLMISEVIEYIRKRVQEKSFKAEFQSFRYDLQHEHEVASQPQNSLKNRFKNVCAYDHSRVILSNISPGVTDYINASYIKSYDKSLAYIASQGPVPASVADMWEMIWQEKVAKVVMLTGFWESSKEKCSRYFEPEGTHLYRDISVRVLETIKEQGFEIKTMQVIKGKIRRHIHHFHFTAWPDHGVPCHPAAILHLREAVNRTKSEEGLDGPIVVHCSAGVGRTGTYIAIDYLITQAEATGELNFIECTRNLRDARVKMIQNLNQYIFVHFAVLEHLLLGDTSILTPDYSQTLDSLVTRRQEMGATQLELQFEVLQLSIREDFLKSIENLADDHLHPVFIPSTKSKLTFIAIQSPSEETREEFLDLIRQYAVKVIVTLEYKENSENYWSDDCLKMISTDNLEDCRIREFDFWERGKARKIHQVYFKAWGIENGLPAVPVLTSFLETVQSQIGDHEVANVIVHCKNGTTRCGLFCAAYVIYKRIQKVPGEVNIYQAIRSIKYSQPAFIENLEQYIHLHELVKECLAKFSIYSNFQKVA